MQIKQRFSCQLVFGYAYFSMDMPIFQLIDHITPNCCYKFFKSLQTYQIGLENCGYVIKPKALKLFINEGLKVKFLPLFQPYCTIIDSL